MTAERLLALLMRANHAGFQGRIVTDYSGRCMFGATCPGFVTDSPSGLGAALMRAIRDDYVPEAEQEAQEKEEDELIELLGDTAADNFGLSTICYWPKVRW